MLWELQYQIRIGDNTFDKIRVFEAEDIKEAEKKAHLWCKDYYGQPDEENDSIDCDNYEFECGCISVTIKIIREIDKGEWKEEQFKNALIENHMLLLPDKPTACPCREMYETISKLDYNGSHNDVMKILVKFEDVDYPLSRSEEEADVKNPDPDSYYCHLCGEFLYREEKTNG